MYIKLLSGLSLLVIENNYKILNNLLSIEYMPIYLFLNFILLNFNTRHLQGTSYRNNKMPNNLILLSSKLNFILFLYSNLFIFIQNLYINYLFLLYLPTYLEFAEYTGNRKLSLENIFFKPFCYFFKLIGNYEIFNEYKIIDNHKQYLIGLHPHGLFPFGTLGSLGLPICKNLFELFPLRYTNELYIGIASFGFYIPIIRDLFLFMGAIDCSKPIIEKFIKNGKSIGLFIGGAEEAKYSDIGNTNLIINKRKGFFKLAIENNLTLVPIYTFGNNNIYKSYDSDIFNIFYYFKRITGFWFPRGKIIFNRINFYTVLGNHIDINETNNIEELKILYIEKLTEIFNKYKDKDNSVKNKNLIIN